MYNIEIAPQSIVYNRQISSSACPTLDYVLIALICPPWLRTGRKICRDLLLVFDSPFLELAHLGDDHVSLERPKKIITTDENGHEETMRQRGLFYSGVLRLEVRSTNWETIASVPDRAIDRGKGSFDDQIGSVFMAMFVVDGGKRRPTFASRLME